MSHTAGMTSPPDSSGDIYQKMDRTLAEGVSAFATRPLEFEPGSKWSYSNTGIATLGRIVEIVSGQPYETFIADRLLKPLSMVDSFYFPPPSTTSRTALVYIKKGAKRRRSGPEIVAVA